MVTFNADLHCLRCPKCKNIVYPKYFKRANGTIFCKVCAFASKPSELLLSKKGQRKKTKRRKVIDADTWDKYKLIKELNKATKDPYKLTHKDYRNLAYISFTYLTAGRVSEILGIREGRKELDKWIVPPIKKGQVYFDNRYNVKVLIIENVPVLKRRRTNLGEYPLRNLAIPYNHEPELIEYFMKYYNTLPDDDDIPIFNISRSWALVLCKRIFGKFNHYWRHARVSDLVKIYDFKDTQLQHYVGWSSTAMASRYVHLSSDDLLKAMLSSFEMKKKSIEKT